MFQYLLRRFGQTWLFLSKIIKLSLSPRDLYHIIFFATSAPPKISIQKSEHGTICGLENDILFKTALDSGINENHFKKIVKSLIIRNTNVLDVGANIGTHSILLSKAVDSGKVFSIEPQSLVYTILQNNLMLNNCENVVTYRFAISDSDNQTLCMEPFSFAGAKINNGARKVETSGLHLGDYVLSKRLDSFNFPKINFIKLDIQGSEIRALKGAKSLIFRDRPILFVEIEEFYLKQFAGSSKELIELILSYDYILFRIVNDYPCDHLCIPREQIDDFELRVAPSLSLNLLKIDGKKVSLSFVSHDSMNYKDIEVFV